MYTNNVHLPTSSFFLSVFNVDISKWSVENVVSGYLTGFQHMFSDAQAFNSDIGKWAVGNNADLQYMFYGATSFNRNLTWNSTLKEAVGMVRLLPPQPDSTRPRVVA